MVRHGINPLPRFLVNGQSTGSIPVTDRGLSYGDGLFETIAVEGGKPRLWGHHLERLNRGCLRLGIPMPDGGLLLRESQGLLAGLERAVLKVTVTRGPGGRGYNPQDSADPSRIVAVYSPPSYPKQWRDEGVRLRICDTRLGLNPGLAGIKHLNRLEQVMARSEWTDPEVAEGLMCDNQGRVISGTMTNVFAVTDGKLLTPLLDECGVAGVFRGLILKLAPTRGFDVLECSMTPDDLIGADEMFVCNSVAGVWPVRFLDTKRFAAIETGRRLAALCEEWQAQMR